MACFIAVVPEGLAENKEVKRLFSKFKRTLNDKDKEVRWVHPSLWHITVLYLGPRSADEREELLHFFQSWRPSQEANKLTLRVQAVGAFSDVHHARVLWLGIQKNQALLDLQSSIAQDFKDYVNEPDERDYNPHITLARFRNSMDVSDLVQLGGRKHFGDYPVRELILFESVLQGNMAKYIPLARLKL